MVRRTSETSESAVSILDEVARICESRTFRKSAVTSRLLTYLVEQDLAGRSLEIKEYTVAVELFGAAEDYDPQIDSLVRVNANRLRQRLEEYYASDPPPGPLRIHLDKGSYTPRYERLGPPDAGPSPQAEVREDAVPATPQILPSAPKPGTTAARFVSFQVAAVLAVALGCALIVVFASLRKPADNPSTAPSRIEPFGGSANLEEFGEFSPDGKTVAFVASLHGENDRAIYLQSIDTDIPHRLTNTDEEAGRPAWSPDGTKVAYLRIGEPPLKQVVVRSVATGAATVIASLRGGPLWLCAIPHLSWAPDGAKLYTSASELPDRPCGIVSIDLASHQVRPLIPPASGIFGDLEAAIAPDGRHLAFMRNYGASRSDVFVADLVTGSLRQITHETADLLGLTWTAHGKSLVVSSNRQDGERRLWEMPLDGGMPKALTDGSSAPSFPSIGSGGRILFTEFHRVSALWRTDRTGSRKIVDNGSGNMDPDISSQGKLLFTSDRSGHQTLWIGDNDGSHVRRLLNGAAGAGRWSPDGKRIAFEAENQIWLSGFDDKSLRQITQGNAKHTSPAWSHDGKEVYYTSDVSGNKEIYRIDLQSGIAEGLTNGGADRAAESDDGRWLYFRHPSSLTGIDAVSLSAGRQTADEQRVDLPLVKDRIFYWQVSADRLLFTESPQTGKVAMLISYKPSDKSFQQLFPLPFYDGADLPAFSFSARDQAVYYCQSAYKVELKMLVRGGRRDTQD